jgi:protease IV
MVADIVRSGAGLLTAPLLAAARAARRAATSSRCVLDVRVGPLPDVRARTLFLESLLRAGRDPAVKAVRLFVDGAPGGWASVGDLAAVIRALREGGTAVWACLEAPGNAAMVLASACDRIFLVPTGEVGLVGVGAELTFFGALLDRLGVRPDFEAAGAYKSFGEPFTRTYASAANREAVGSLVAELQRQVVTSLAEGRGLAPEAVLDALAHAPLSARDALERGLVDELAYPDQVHDALEDAFGEGIRTLDFDTWARADLGIFALERVGQGGRMVAVVHLDGPIVMDKGGRGTAIRAHKVVKTLERLRRWDRVGAVVLHVNSPGGSALASDLLWREVDLMVREKPVVACFEDVAASGGYYLSAPVSEIVARPGTLTGSIGVFGGKLVLGEGLRRVGIHTQPLAAAPNAHVFSPSRRFDDGQRERFRASLQRFYDGFVERVAEGRGRPVDEVEPHCRGRVWTGVQARDRGLVDRYGTLREAVARARALADLPPDAPRGDVNTLPRRSVVQWVAQRALPGAARAALPVDTGPVMRALGLDVPPGLQVVLEHPNQPLALLPYELGVR